MTDSKSVARISQTRMIPPLLWNARDFVLGFNFTKAYITGKMITTADFLSGLKTNRKEKIFLEVSEDVPEEPMEVNIEATATAQRDEVFF